MCILGPKERTEKGSIIKSCLSWKTCGVLFLSFRSGYCHNTSLLGQLLHQLIHGFLVLNGHPSLKAGRFPATSHMFLFSFVWFPCLSVLRKRARITKTNEGITGISLFTTFGLTVGSLCFITINIIKSNLKAPSEAVNLIITQKLCKL